MSTYEFRVHEKGLGNGTHTYECEDVIRNVLFPLIHGGNGSYVGRYPEIETYMQAAYGVTVSLVFQSGRDILHQETREIFFNLGGVTVIVNEMGRPTLRLDFH